MPTSSSIRPSSRSIPPARPRCPTTAVARNLEVLREYAARSPSGKRRRLTLRFCVSPVAILGDDRVEAVELVRNTLVADDRGRVSAVPTEERELMPCGVVFRSVGYRGIPVEGVPFDEERATMRNEGGRVLDEDGRPVPGVYCTGWIKRGPTGIIGTNKKDATETAELLLEDARSGVLPRNEGASAEKVDAFLLERGCSLVEYAGWEAIDTAERGLGEPHGRPRIKLVTWDELLQAALERVS